MFSPLETTMELLPLCLCVLAWAAGTAADGSGPKKIIVKEDSDVILPCSLSTKQSIVQILFDWKKDVQKDGPQKEVFMYDAGTHYNNGRTGQSVDFKGRVSHFQDELKHGNASIMIRNTNVKDSGIYTCVFPNLPPSEKYNIELVVGASPKPHIRTLDQTDKWSLLECEVQGAFPKPEVEWRNRAGNKLPAAEPQVTESGGKYDIVLQTTVTKTDNYTCVSTQEEICHNISDVTRVYFSDPRSDEKPKELSTGSFGSGLGVGVAVTILIIGIAGVVFYITQKRKKDEAQVGLSSEQNSGSGAARPLNLEEQQSGSVL